MLDKQILEIQANNLCAMTENLHRHDILQNQLVYCIILKNGKFQILRSKVISIFDVKIIHIPLALELDACSKINDKSTMRMYYVMGKRYPLTHLQIHISRESAEIMVEYFNGNRSEYYKSMIYNISHYIYNHPEFKEHRKPDVIKGESLPTVSVIKGTIDDSDLTLYSPEYLFKSRLVGEFFIEDLFIYEYPRFRYDNSFVHKMLPQIRKSLHFHNTKYLLQYNTLGSITTMYSHSYGYVVSTYMHHVHEDDTDIAESIMIKGYGDTVETSISNLMYIINSILTYK